MAVHEHSLLFVIVVILSILVNDGADALALFPPPLAERPSHGSHRQQHRTTSATNSRPASSQPPITIPTTNKMTTVATRRDVIEECRIAAASFLGAAMAMTASPSPAAAETSAPSVPPTGENDRKDSAVREIVADSYSFSIPNGWKVIKQQKSPKDDGDASNEGRERRRQQGLLFSAFDLQGGSTLTVVRERACPTRQYIEQPKLCDLVLPSPPPQSSSSSSSSSNSLLFSEATLAKDAQKLLNRRDDRDNLVLGAPPSILESATMAIPPVVEVVARTEIPTGAVRKDAIGMTVQDQLVRIARARVLVETDGDGDEINGSILSVWLSAPQDEWQAPVPGTRLLKVMESIRLR